MNPETSRERPSAQASQAQTLTAVLTGGERERTALKTPNAGPSLTFGTLASEVERLAGSLQRAGVDRGDRVALMVPGGIEFVQVLLAVTSLGAAAAPLNPAYTREEYAFYLGDLEPEALIVAEGEGAAVRQAVRDERLIEIGSRDGRIQLRDVAGGRRATGALPSAGPDDVALLLHTSGTTSRPKQVPLLHRNLMASARTIAEHYELGPEDVSFAAMPLFHVHGLVASVLATLIAGGTAITPPALAARDFWSAMDRDRVTWFSGSPTILAMLLDRRPEPGAVSSLRFVRSCSAPLGAGLAERIEHELSVPILQAYGMTEASHQIASNPLPPAARDPGSVGPPTGTKVAALDGEGNELAAGSPGEISIRGPGVMGGYLANPDANAAAFVNGWFRTGDLGVIDARGYIRLEARLKELINRGGEKISPFEVEEILRGHPAVHDVACFPVPDAKYGEVVGAAVVLTEPTDSQELLALCHDRLASFKVPRVMRIVDSLPKTATGKVLRYKLAAELAEDGA
jgi:acyl-CoA synthetase (AMP-forming)/AMP-acid ligase II